MLVGRAGIYKMHVSLANWEDPDQSASSSLHCLGRPLWQVIIGFEI